MKHIDIAIWKKGETRELVNGPKEERDKIMENVEKYTENLGYLYCFWVLPREGEDVAIVGAFKDLGSFQDTIYKLCKAFKVMEFQPVCTTEVWKELAPLMSRNLH